MTQTAGARFRQAVQAQRPLQVVGTINAMAALMARQAGHKAIYLSGGGLAANSLGLPDLGISTVDDVLTDVRRITCRCWWTRIPASAVPSISPAPPAA